MKKKSIKLHCKICGGILIGHRNKEFCSRLCCDLNRQIYWDIDGVLKMNEVGLKKATQMGITIRLQ